jgi:hypothetical protein
MIHQRKAVRQAGLELSILARLAQPAKSLSCRRSITTQKTIEAVRSYLANARNARISKEWKDTEGLDLKEAIGNLSLV